MLWEPRTSSEAIGAAVLSSIAKMETVSMNAEGGAFLVKAEIPTKGMTRALAESIQSLITTDIMRMIGYPVYLFLVEETYWDDNGNIVIPEHGVSIPIGCDIGFGFGFELNVKVEFAD